MPEKLVCDRCGITYTDDESIQSAKREFESWKALCQKDGDAPRGLMPCPILPCPGELELVQSGCRPGWCAKNKAHYGGGWHQDIKEGRCPICKGQLEKQK